MSSGRTAEAWFAEYGESHQNKVNKGIHWIAVPVIYATVIGLLWAIPQPEFLASISWLNWAGVALVPVMYFYARMSRAIAIGMALMSAVFFWVWSQVEAAGLPIWQSALAIFVVSWIFQFIGHKVEGKKPSFFKDLQFLLVGPAWVIGFLYRKLGIKY